MECYSVDIDLGDELEIAVELEEDISVDVNFEGDITTGDCPTITEIDGGIADSDSVLSVNPFAAINGLIDGGDALNPL